MPSHRIHRLRAHLQQQFRSAPHVSGAASVKPRDYEPGETIEGPTPYAVFFAMRETDNPLHPGDLLETEGGALKIYKFVGFEDATWLVPEIPQNESADAEVALK
jgi:hypothetical protein